MMDEFYRLKPGETVRNVRRYNSAAVLLTDFGSDFNVWAGEKKRVAFSLSNYDKEFSSGVFRVSLVACQGGNPAQRRAAAENGVEVWTWEGASPRAPCGDVTKLGECAVEIPASDVPVKYLLRASFSGGAVRAENEWELYAFPRTFTHSLPHSSTPPRVVDDISRDDLLAAMKRGESVLLLGAGPFRSLPTTFRIGMAGRCSGNLATVIKPEHPVFRDFPHDGYCGWQFRRLLEGGRAVQLEAGIPFDPIVDVASSEKSVIRQAALFEYRIGEGRLLVCPFAFHEDDPAAGWLKDRLVEYAASDSFAPTHFLTADQLRAVVDAPLLTGESNSNLARNPNDPSSAVRAANLAQP
jgi:hypothetical protein